MTQPSDVNMNITCLSMLLLIPPVLGFGSGVPPVVLRSSPSVHSHILAVIAGQSVFPLNELLLGDALQMIIVQPLCFKAVYL